MNVTLRMRFAGRPVHTPSAWLIPGDSANQWLQELSAWRIPMESLRLLVVSRPDASAGAAARPLGLLAQAPAGATAHASGRVHGYCLLADRLFVPVDAQFETDVDDRDWAELLPTDDRLYVWHPTAGLIAMAEDRVLRVVDLLRPPLRSTTAWDAAVPGLAMNSRLLSITLEEPPDAQQILDEGRDEIGSQQPLVETLPPSPLEPAAGAGIALFAMRQIAKAVQWLAAQLPKSSGRQSPGQNQPAPSPAGKPGLRARLEGWAQRQIARIATAMQAARHREIARLLNLLETNPDEGLKFALPMGEGLHRGRAAPGSKLTPRNVDFSHKKLGGGKAADVWELPYEYHQQLIERYRALANREIRLGRYRRAAYILAHLLGDYGSAARALADGRHWRDAATLYEERLHQPREAAKCLLEGGLWTEAIALFQRLGEHEQVGDLYRKLDQHEEAETAYRQAVAARREAQDFVSAARLLEQKLAAPDEAWEMLQAGWPDSPQAARCLDESFRLLARQGRHETAREYVVRLCGAHFVNRATTRVLVDLLAHVAVTYPEEAVRAATCDQVRVLAARQLRSADDAEAAILAAAVGRLAPGDRLLPRDAQRFVAQRRRRQRPLPPVHAKPRGTIYPLRTIELPRAHPWCAATSSGETFYAAGCDDGHLRVVRGLWDGTIQEPSFASWRVHATWGGPPGDTPAILLAADPRGGGTLLVHVVGQRPLARRSYFPRSDRFADVQEIGRNSGFTTATLAACQAPHDVVYTVNAEDSPTLAIVAHSLVDQSLLSTTSFDPSAMLLEDALLRIPPPLMVREGWIYLGVGNHLCAWGPQGASHTLECPTPVRELAGSQPHSRCRVAAALAQGGVLCWGRLDQRHFETFAHDMVKPTVCINRGGWLVAANESEIQVYSTHEEKLRFHARRPGPGAAPIAVMPAQHIDQFAICTAQGVVQLFAIES
jgi:tetratricopeptide (TPR) repeat protein